MIVKLTGLRYHLKRDVADVIGPGNLAYAEREPAYDKPPVEGCDGLAYRVDCKGQLIGYLPLIRTLRDYWHEAKTEDKQHRIERWAFAVRAVREQWKLDGDRLGQTKWPVLVWELLYTDGYGFKTFEELNRLPLKEQENWSVQQIAIKTEVEI